MLDKKKYTYSIHRGISRYQVGDEICINVFTKEQIRIFLKVFRKSSVLNIYQLFLIEDGIIIINILIVDNEI